MGVYIKGMEMPNHCMECEIAIEDNDYDKHCPFTKVECLNIARQVNCPLIEIPKPHGRLIDADACIDDIRNNNQHAWEALAYAPTVIEDEVEE